MLFLPRLEVHGIFNNSLEYLTLSSAFHYQTLCKYIAATIKKAHCASSVVLRREKIQPAKTNKHTYTHKSSNKTKQKPYQNEQNQNIHQKAPTHKTPKSVGYDTDFVLEPLLNYVLKYSKIHYNRLLFILELSFIKHCHNILWHKSILFLKLIVSLLQKCCSSKYLKHRTHKELYFQH